MSSVVYLPLPLTEEEREAMLRAMILLPNPPLKLNMVALHAHLKAAVKLTKAGGCRVARGGTALAYVVFLWGFPTPYLGKGSVLTPTLYAYATTTATNPGFAAQST